MGVVFCLSTICIIMLFLLTANDWTIIMSFLLTVSDRTKYIRYSGANCALGPSKSIRCSGHYFIAVFVVARNLHFHIFYCNSARLSNVVRYNSGLFVIAGFVIAGCHCRCKLYNALFEDNFAQIISHGLECSNIMQGFWLVTEIPIPIVLKCH